MAKGRGHVNDEAMLVPASARGRLPHLERGRQASHDLQQSLGQRRVERLLYRPGVVLVFLVESDPQPIRPQEALVPQREEARAPTLTTQAPEDGGERGGRLGPHAPAELLPDGLEERVRHVAEVRLRHSVVQPAEARVRKARLGKPGGRGRDALRAAQGESTHARHTEPRTRPVVHDASAAESSTTTRRGEGPRTRRRSASKPAATPVPAAGAVEVAEKATEASPSAPLSRAGESGEPPSPACRGGRTRRRSSRASRRRVAAAISTRASSPRVSFRTSFPLPKFNFPRGLPPASAAPPSP